MTTYNAHLKEGVEQNADKSNITDQGCYFSTL